LETATVERPVPAVTGLVGRARSLSANTIALWVFAALTVVAILLSLLVWVTYPNYDSYYSLLWGREILDGHLPSFEAYRAPTEHPLGVAFGTLLAPLGQDADRVMVLSTIVAFIALAGGTYRLGSLCFTPFVGALAAFLVLTRFDFPSLAVRAYIDIPFMATIVWAAALEAAKPRRGPVVFLLLAAAGLMRPEAWILSGVYFLWMGWRATWRERAVYAVLTALGPVLWALTDFTVTGNPLFSLTSTQDLAAELERQRSGGDVLAALPSYLRGTVKTPVFFAGLIGLALAFWRFPLRTAIPLMLFLAGAFTFVATGLAGLSVIVRYLLVPSVMLSLFAAFTVGGWTMLRRGSAARRIWAGAALVGTVAGIFYTTLNPPNPTRFNNELTFRGDQGSSLNALLDQRAVRDGLGRCGGIVSVPTHKLIPDVRWLLDLPESRVVARSDTSRAAQRKAEHGVALFPTGRTNVLRTGFAVNTDARAQVPAPGFRRIATDRYFAAYLRCPSRPG
jgi:hypothetical protein